MRARLPADLYPGHVSVSKQMGDVLRCTQSLFPKASPDQHGSASVESQSSRIVLWILNPLQKTLEEKFIERSSNTLLLRHRGRGVGVPGSSGRTEARRIPEASKERKGPRGSHQGEVVRR